MQFMPSYAFLNEYFQKKSFTIFTDFYRLPVEKKPVITVYGFTDFSKKP